MAAAATLQQAYLLRLLHEIWLMILDFLPERDIKIIVKPLTNNQQLSQNVQSAPILFYTKDGICRVDRIIRSDYSFLLAKRAISDSGGRITMQITDLDFSAIQSAHIYLRALGFPKPQWTVCMSLTFTTKFAQTPCGAGLRTWLDWYNAEIAAGETHNFEYECAQIDNATRQATNGAMKQISAVAEYMNWFAIENYGNPRPQLKEIKQALHVFLTTHYQLADPIWYDKWIGKPVYYPA